MTRGEKTAKNREAAREFKKFLDSVIEAVRAASKSKSGDAYRYNFDRAIFLVKSFELGLKSTKEKQTLSTTLRVFRTLADQDLESAKIQTKFLILDLQEWEDEFVKAKS